MCDIHSFAFRFTESTAITRAAHKLPSIGPRVFLVSPTNIIYRFREVIIFLIRYTQTFLKIYHSLGIYMWLYVIYASVSFLYCVLYCCLCTLIVMVIYFYFYVYSVLCVLIHCVAQCIVCVQICSVLLPSDVKPIAVNEIYIINLLSNTHFSHLKRKLE
jgi:hypothetical protein